MMDRSYLIYGLGLQHLSGASRGTFRVVDNNNDNVTLKHFGEP